MYGIRLSVYGQGGCLFIPDRYATVPKTAEASVGPQFAPLPSTFSLKSYVPPPQNQGTFQSCVPWAMGFACYSTMWAIEQGVTNQKEILEHAYSAMFPFLQISGGRNAAMDLKRMADFLMKEGDCLYQAFNPEDLDEFPTQPLVTAARNNRIAGYNALFESDDPDSLKIMRVKQVLTLGKPVVAGLILDKTFGKLQGDTWNPTEVEAGGHAVLVVGYNNALKAFEIMNSQGGDWGNEGFCYIGYEDFAKRCRETYELTLKKAPEIEELKGNFYFRYPTGYEEEEIVFEEAQTVYRSKGQYGFVRTDWQVNDMFQVILRQCQAEKYAYIFSIDAHNSMRIHLPREEQYGGGNRFLGVHESPKIPYDAAEIILPDEHSGFAFTTFGTDNLIILYSGKEIPDFLDAVQDVRNAEGSIYERLLEVWGNQLASPEEVQYETNKMEFRAEIRNDKIIPLILSVEAH